MAKHLLLFCYTNKETINESSHREASECCSISSRDGHVAIFLSKPEHSNIQNVRL
jgi:hypothetical protein